jgi:drug/metabolite transporter (DMT)-like permease
MGWVLLDEVPAALAFLGGALCLAGVAVARQTDFRRRR